MPPAAGQAIARPYPDPLPARAMGPADALPGVYRDSTSSHASADFEAEPGTAGRARRLTRNALARWHLDHLADDAETIASELISNALNVATKPRGTLPAIIFAIHRLPSELRIIVWDNGPGQPHRTEPAPDAETGRGLTIVDSLSGQKWGWWPTPDSVGKVVWAACALEAPAASDVEELLDPASDRAPQTARRQGPPA